MRWIFDESSFCEAPWNATASPSNKTKYIDRSSWMQQVIETKKIKMKVIRDGKAIELNILVMVSQRDKQNAL
jgi:hypothetical protein